MKKLIATTVVAGTLGMTFLPITTFAAEPVKAQVTGKVERQLSAHYDNVSQDMIEEWKKDKMFKVFDHGNGNVDVIRKYPALQGMVFVNGQAVKVNEQGEYSMEVEVGEFNVEFREKDGKVIQKHKMKAEKGKKHNVDLINTILFSDLIESMEHNVPNKNTVISGTSSPSIVPEATDGGSGGSYAGPSVGQYCYTNQPVHCNRFNGLYSDNRYWPQTDARALNNFRYSDCDYNFSLYGCPSPFADTLCDGLNAQGKGVHDCSSVKAGWSMWFWPRNNN
ncbi:hypothetical protein CBW65_03945 [Tumebacillus avium]|uniref:Uncharacterized protein n=1 Tax=Tumebacillus avium TaxID=1903704 RepID=A0A1Y0IJQ5_9BACL|nr:hypothetical protein [Tumebacillus avium]ARU60309.1 hypothetical protein CBW65_03945 [Tumebacillus avium]